MTPIEELIGRQLEKENRGSVPHFKPGQMVAKLVPEEELEGAEMMLPDCHPRELSYVDQMGHAWLMLVSKYAPGHPWKAAVAFRGGQMSVTQVPAPKLTAAMIAALDLAG